MFYILIAIITGVIIVVTRIINYLLAKEIGNFQGTLVNYITGLLFSFIFLLLSGELSSIAYLDLKAVPFWAYLGGAAGVIAIVLSSYITPRMSAFYLTLFIFIGQLFVGIIIDYFTLKELSLGKIAGGLLVLFGLSYNLLLDKKQAEKATLICENS
jgi:transporter family-2 protein